MKGRSKGRALERRPFEKSCLKKDAQNSEGNLRAGSGVYPEMLLFPIGCETMKGRVDGRGSLLPYSEGKCHG